MTALLRIVVAVDPAVTKRDGSCETGIIVIGRGANGQGYVLADLSGKYTPDEWAQTVIRAYKGWSADLVVGEVNNGGDLVEKNLRSVDPHVRYKEVRASRGKAKRAEPTVGLYERELIHHVGLFGELEDQMCLWEPEEPEAMPCDRLDAMVWGLTELFVDEMGPVLLGSKLLNSDQSHRSSYWKRMA